MSSMDGLIKIMEQLRDPDTGCPWDLEQTMTTIAPHTLEEAYELCFAIENQGPEEIKNECGDLLFQVVYYAHLAKEKKWFDFNDILKTLEAKLIDRHPHVFGQAQVKNARDQSKQWEQIKNQSKSSVLDDIADNIPALSRAQKIQKRVGYLGFDWHDIEGVLDKIEEELQEVRDALHQDKQHAQEECGDLLFAVTNLARWLQGDAEQLCRKASIKFEKRFRLVESQVRQGKKKWEDHSLNELERYWQDAKLQLNPDNSSDD